MILCEHCIEAIRSKGEKIYVGEMISQDISYDDEKEKWISKYNESIIKCDWCKESDPTLYRCK